MSLVTLLIVLSSSPKFCVGYQFGFKAGYCHDLGPLCMTSRNASSRIPTCPPDEPQESSWQDGYDRGWDDGEKARNDMSRDDIY